MQSVFFKKEKNRQSAQNWDVLEISGPDSRDFLHRLTSASFKDFSLKENQVTSGCLLQPNGKILCYFEALCLSKDRFWLIPSSENAAEEFEKMHFREDLKITLLPKKYVFYRMLFDKVPPIFPTLPAHTLHYFNDDVLVFDLSKTSTSSIYDWGLLVASDQTLIWEKSLLEHSFQKAENPDFIRIFNKEPEAGFEITNQVMPLEVGLEFAVHENKGCFPGQEVIERIRSMGKPPRLLVRIKGSGETPAREQKITNEDGIEVGQITSVTSTPSGSSYDWIALSLFKRVQYKEEGKYWVNENQVTLD